MNTSIQQILASALLLFHLLLTSCSERAPEIRPPSESLSKAHYFAFNLGDNTIQVQLAVTQSESTRGLMFRKSLAANHGMLFIYPGAEERSFWMRNTSIPLDIGYFSSDGALEEIHPLYPHVETSVSSRSERIQYALEMNQGWFRRNGIKPGESLDLAEIGSALAARGFDPEDFGIQ